MSTGQFPQRREIIGEDADSVTFATDEGVQRMPMQDGGYMQRFRCAKGCHLILVPDDGDPIYVDVDRVEWIEGVTIDDIPILPESGE